MEQSTKSMWRGVAGPGTARHGAAGRGRARLGLGSNGAINQISSAGLGVAGPGTARRGKAGRGKARAPMEQSTNQISSARHGRAWLG
jgi:hypothetical protein